MRRVKIVGAGQLGSRHLQALKAVATPLDITVIDPSADSLRVAEERYNAVASDTPHQISFSSEFEKTGDTDVAIVATSSNVRFAALQRLVDASPVKNLVLEKLLFNRKDEYTAAAELLKAGNINTWVNCPMRMMPVYEHIRSIVGGSRLSYRVTGSQFGLVTNAIHYIDHAVHLTGENAFTLDTSALDNTPIPSKRAGFLELNGTLRATFANGSQCEVTCYPDGDAPVIVEIFNEKHRFIVRESERKLWYSSHATSWAWEEQEAQIPFQSQLTTEVVNRLLATNECGLTPYASSMETHLSLLDPLAVLVRTHADERNQYPFT
ncbi:Gfo/Idh/MocA family oxidoreductase [Achromobacter insuavis]|uniref:Gfo/Idh/MocA family oxidoreductase n=1 Tax=Achromobacter insuavis TaxID=1287735 RepID=UPI001EEBAC0D|nr:Gfo/Idh/MocA family oxidoreductase [Achromobacter insuavis]